MINKQLVAIVNSSSKPQIISLINRCKSMREIKQIHAQIIVKVDFFPHETSVETSKLASFCAISPHGSLAYAKTIFYHQPNPSVPLYNALIRGLSLSNNQTIESISLFQKMLQTGLRPNNMTFPFVIKACSESLIVQSGVLIHTHVVKCGFECDVYIRSSLIRLYGNGKNLLAAKQLFDIYPERDVVCWNSMMDVYVKSGEMELARGVFDQMPCRDVISWNSMINGYGIIGNIEEAKRLFDEMPERNVVSWNSLLGGYVKCGNVDDACKTFHQMPCRDVISWNDMLACYAQSGKSHETLALFGEMKGTGIRPTEATVVSLLSALGHLGALDRGLHLHSYIIEHKIEINPIVATALIDMYAKCGSISHATEVFNSMESRDVLAWNTMIIGLAMHGNAKEAQTLFRKMQQDGVAPNDVTFTAMLGAFRHAGMTEEGQKLLACMTDAYGVDPKVEHYGCVIDLLARAGRLEEALHLIRTMPMEASACAWGALLGGCRIHGNAELAGVVGKLTLDLQPQHSGRYVLLSNIYAAARRWDDARKVRNLMKAKGVSKVAGVSMIESKGNVHRFVAGDCSHPESKKIYEKWGEISTQLKNTLGYWPDTEQALFDIEEEEKEHALSVHSEKLAIAYGFLHLDTDVVIRIVKNLRVCRDCHHVTKLISRIYDLEIVVRDRNRFHHFKDGKCSCQDFW